MGIVYKAFEEALRRVVALKVLRPEIAGNAALIRRLRQEATLAAGLNHPNIVPVFHIEEGQAPRYFTMEYVNGPSLREKAERDGPLAQEEVARLAVQVCDALGYAHQHGIIHRDIKPGNVLVESGSLRARITDFGLARDLTGQLTEASWSGGNLAGTLVFMSPEQNLGRILDHRTDLFSLGVTLYWLLTGQLAFHGRTPAEMAIAFRDQTPRPPSGLNSAVGSQMDRIVMRLLAIDADARYQTCAEVISDLRALLGGSPSIVPENVAPSRDVLFSVQQGDVAHVPADMLVLKYAGQLVGVAQDVADDLVRAGVCSYEDIRPTSRGTFSLIGTKGVISPAVVVFASASPLPEFDYERMRRFARRVIHGLARASQSGQYPQASRMTRLTTTVHGGGYGLDEGESLQSLIRGFQDGLSQWPGLDLREIVFVELRRRVADTLASVLKAMTEDATGPGTMRLGPARGLGESALAIWERPGQSVAAGGPGSDKSRVMVSMPMSEEFLDSYQFGIYEPVRKCGFICERADEHDRPLQELARLKERIRACRFLIADLTEGRPEVYLTVGLALGHGVPVVCLARKGETIPTALCAQKCLYYSNIRQLARDIEKLLLELSNAREP
jgi:hypothetical protein